MNERLYKNEERRITVSVEELQKMLSLGKTSCRKLGEEAGAVVRVGKRKLYRVDKVEAYINSLNETQGVK